MLELIRADDFYQPRAQEVFLPMQALTQRGEPIDVVTLEAQLARASSPIPVRPSPTSAE